MKHVSGAAPLTVVILAAGQGKRMRTRCPKVLHSLGGEPLLKWVIEAAFALHPERVVVVYGSGGNEVRSAFQNFNVQWVEQTQQCGTGHAVLQAINALPAPVANERVLVMYGDVPLMSADVLQPLLEACGADEVGLLTAFPNDVGGLGRILRDESGAVCGIVEERDASPEQRALREVNTGVITAPLKDLRTWLPALSNDNAQQEYYLTDVIKAAYAAGTRVMAVPLAEAWVMQGVNDLVQLVALEQEWTRRCVLQWQREGVLIREPQHITLRGKVHFGDNVVLEGHTVLEGEVYLGDGCVVEPHVILRHAQVGEGVRVKAFSILEHCRVGSDAVVGPFARLRPDTVLEQGVHIGNFVEVKHSTIGAYSKINHLSYVGDATVGQRVNVGAGTITCNYDGALKHPTWIGDDVFVGSNTSLIAPIKIGAGATIGAGSTVSREVPAHQLTVARASQAVVRGWKRPQKEKDFVMSSQYKE